MAVARKSRLFWRIFQLYIIVAGSSSVALRIIVLEPGYLSTEVVNATMQISSPKLTIVLPSVENEDFVPRNTSRGCQLYDDNAANALAYYLFNQTRGYVGETYIVVLECDNVAWIATTFGEELNYPVITSVWKPQEKSISNLRIDYRSLSMDPFFHSVELFLKSYHFRTVAIICQEYEDDPHLHSLCDKATMLFTKAMSVRRINLPSNFSKNFDDTVTRLNLATRVLLLLLPLQDQRQFLIESSRTILWSGSYLFLCTSFDADTTELLAPFMLTENEDSAPPLPLFVVRIVYQDDQTVLADELADYRENITRFTNWTKPVNRIELRELFTLQKIITLIAEIRVTNSSLNESRTADLLPLLIGAEPIITEIVFEKVMPDTSLQSFASFSPQAPDIYESLFDSSIFDSWWPNMEFPPVDLPACIYCYTEKVDESLMAVVILPVLLIAIPLIVLAIRRRQAENASKGNSNTDVNATESTEYDSWNIKDEELSPFGRFATSKSAVSIGSHNSHSQLQHHSKEAMRYKQTVVWVGMREMTYQYIPDANQIQYILKVKAINHANIAAFYGLLLSLDPHFTELGIVVEFCAKGSLYDLIAEEQNRFNPALTSILIKDVVAGMTYLHASVLGCHGSLKSPNCLITNRFNVKITDYYLRATPILPPALATDESSYTKMLWTAPEILRGPLIRLRKGTKEGDIYSFAIILQEITMQTEPFRLPDHEPHEMTQTHKSAKEIVHAVIAVPQEPQEPYRPKLLSKFCDTELQQLIKRCWAEKIVERPTFKIIGDYITHIPGFNTGDSYLDYVLKRMEKYSNDLEARVAETTDGLLDEKKKSDDLLAQMMPRSVMEAMQKGQVVLPESFEFVTLGFTAVIDFASIAYSSTPLQIVLFLNGLYSMFDNALEAYDLYKVETIQDSYVIASGLPIRNGNEHCRQVSLVSLQMLKDISTVTIEHMKNTAIEMKIGIHTGTCAAGVIGQKAPRYCIFGDTVNTTSRMCTTSEAQRTQISQITKSFLEDNYPGEFIIKTRGTIEVKGKGQMNTYYLDARP